jgi:hypothetical protein
MKQWTIDKRLIAGFTATPLAAKSKDVRKISPFSATLGLALIANKANYV